MKIIELHVLKDAMPSCVAITADVLATANRLRAAKGRAPAFTLRFSGPGARAAQALVRPLTPVMRESVRRRPDVLLVASVVAVSEPAVLELLQRRDAVNAMRLLTTAAASGVELAASCSAVFLLAESGLLDGRRATTTWWLSSVLQRRHPMVTVDADQLVVRDRGITTAGAAMAHLDLMLSLVARHGGSELARTCANFLVLDQRRSQSSYMSLALMVADDAEFARAERWARKRLADGVTVEDMAGILNVSTRTLARRVEKATGLSPVRFLQRLRMERAIELLETTTHSVERISHMVGYAEPTTLRRLLKRELGEAPRALRRPTK